MATCLDLVKRLTELRIARKNADALALLSDDAFFSTPNEGDHKGKDSVMALWNAQDSKGEGLTTGIETKEAVAVDANTVTRDAIFKTAFFTGVVTTTFKSDKGKIISMIAAKKS